MFKYYTEFPTFVDYFSQMRTADEDYASKFISSQILFMKGPPNRPNSDPYGLISVSTVNHPTLNLHCTQILPNQNIPYTICGQYL